MAGDTAFVSPFRVAFPSLKLPDNYGGLRAIVVMSMQQPANPHVVYALCIDERGRVHQGVPLSIGELRLAAAQRVNFIEVPQHSAPDMPLVGVKP